MEIQKSQCEKIMITDVKGLDPITVFLEDLQPNKGRITITCWDETWSSYWGGMGERTISQFFCSCDHHYIGNKLSRINSSVPDYDAFRVKARKQIGKRLARKELRKDQAKNLLEELKDCETECQTDQNYDLFCNIFGHGDWMFDVPEKPNHEYKYLCKIIDTVQEALAK